MSCVTCTITSYVELAERFSIMAEASCTCIVSFYLPLNFLLDPDVSGVQFISFHEPCSDLTLCCLQCHHQRPLLFSTQCHPPKRTFKVGHRIYDMDNQMIDGGEQLHSNEFKNLSKRRTQTKRGTTFLEKKKRNYLSVEQSEEWYRGMGGHFPSSLKMVNNDNKL